MRSGSIIAWMLLTAGVACEEASDPVSDDGLLHEVALTKEIASLKKTRTTLSIESGQNTGDRKAHTKEIATLKKTHNRPTSRRLLSPRSPTNRRLALDGYADTFTNVGDAYGIEGNACMIADGGHLKNWLHDSAKAAGHAGCRGECLACDNCVGYSLALSRCFVYGEHIDNCPATPPGWGIDPGSAGATGPITKSNGYREDWDYKHNHHTDDLGLVTRTCWARDKVFPTCANKDGLGGGAIEDADCGAGNVAMKNATACSKAPCEIAGGKADFDKCCMAATCGDPTGKDSGAVNNTECGDGYVYAASQSATVCSVGPCEISTGNKTDRGKCCKAVCESSACGSGSVLKPTSASLTCGSFNCSLSDQSTCCDVTCKVPKVAHGAVSGAGCIAEATVVHGMTCTVKAEAAGYECDAPSMSCANGTMVAPTCKLSKKDDDGKYDGREGVKEYEYKGSVSVTSGAANASQVEAAMKSALAKHFGCDESKVVITSKQESPTVLMVSFTIVLSTDAAKSTEAKMNALDKDMSGLNGDFIKQLQAAGVDTTNCKASSFKMKKVDNAALISTSPTVVLGRVTTLAALWTVLW